MFEQPAAKWRLAKHSVRPGASHQLEMILNVLQRVGWRHRASRMISHGVLTEPSTLWLCRDEVDRWAETPRMERRRQMLPREIPGSAMHSQVDNLSFAGMAGRQWRLSLRRAQSYLAFEASEHTGWYQVDGTVMG